jgi:hypothetical protein
VQMTVQMKCGEVWNRSAGKFATVLAFASFLIVAGKGPGEGRR